MFGVPPNKQFKRLKISPVKTYEEKRGDLKVYEITEKEFQIICDDPVDWADDAAWRHSTGSNLSGDMQRFNINNHYITAWINDRRNGRGPHSFKSLTEYFDNVFSITTENNLASVFVSLAEENKMKISDMLKRFQG